MIKVSGREGKAVSLFPPLKHKLPAFLSRIEIRRTISAKRPGLFAVRRAGAAIEIAFGPRPLHQRLAAGRAGIFRHDCLLSGFAGLAIVVGQRRGTRRIGGAAPEPRSGFLALAPVQSLATGGTGKCRRWRVIKDGIDQLW